MLAKEAREERCGGYSNARTRMHKRTDDCSHAHMHTHEGCWAGLGLGFFGSSLLGGVWDAES